MSKAEELGVVNVKNPSLCMGEFSDACSPALEQRTRVTLQQKQNVPGTFED